MTNSPAQPCSQEDNRPAKPATVLRRPRRALLRGYPSRVLRMLALIAWFSSVGLVWRYGGPLGLIVYSAVVLSAPGWLPRLPLTRRALLFLAGLTAMVVVLVVLLLYPQANNQSGIAGSDSDDALNLAVRSVLAGHYPYSQTTYLGNPIAPLPGAVLLALPFVVLGSSAYQALAWWPAFAFRLRAETDLKSAGLVIALVLSSVAVWHSLSTGGDGFVNGIYVALATLAVARRPRAGWAILWGVTLTSRILFWPVAPLTLIVIAQRDRGAAWRVASVTGLTMSALIIPLWAWSPDRFTPLHTTSKLTLLGTTSPWPGIAAYVLAFVSALVWLRRDDAPEVVRLLRSAVLVLIAPVLVLTILFVLLRGEQGLAYCVYGLEALPFAALLAVIGSPRASPTPGEELGSRQPP